MTEIVNIPKLYDVLEKYAFEDIEKMKQSKSNWN